MADSSAAVEIPKRALFKAAEVCEIVKVQPYVLRSWESEFPGLGVAKAPGAPRIYRRTDVEQVVRIKHLLLVEGLTLAGARRRLEEEAAPVAADTPLDELMGRHARERITEVKRGLRALLDLLSGGEGELRLTPPVSRARPVPVTRAKASRGGNSKSASPRNGHRSSSRR
jgi:DNA-binding transcriptional MerR regulator